MLKHICLMFAIVRWSSGNEDQVTDGTNLISCFGIFRHGDRTPVEQTLPFLTNPEAVFKACQHYGFGQLTNVGKRNAYALGKTIRQRYNKLLSPQYNRSEIYLRSTDSTRTKMSALLAMAAVYPAGDERWSSSVNWEPVPYTTVPVKYDFNQASLNCPVFKDEIMSIMMTNSNETAKYSAIVDTIAEIIGLDKLIGSTAPGIIYGIYDALTSQISLGIPLDERIEKLYPELTKAAGDALSLTWGNEVFLDLQAGVLLNEFFKYAEMIMNGEDTPRVRIYSAHDVNVYALMAASQVYPKQGPPKYSSFFSLELRKVKGSDQYVVLAVYQPSPKEDLIYLPIKGCGSLLCDFNEFKAIVSKFLLDEDTWRTQCGFTHDLEIDDSSVA